MRYAPGRIELTKTAYNNRQLDEIVQRIHKYQDTLTSVYVEGLSESTKGSVEAELAKERVSDFAQQLIDRGVNPSLIQESYAFANSGE